MRTDAEQAVIQLCEICSAAAAGRRGLFGELYAMSMTLGELKTIRDQMRPGEKPTAGADPMIRNFCLYMGLLIDALTVVAQEIRDAKG